MPGHGKSLADGNHASIARQADECKRHRLCYIRASNHRADEYGGSLDNILPISGTIWVPIILHYATDATNTLVFNITGQSSFFKTSTSMTEGQRTIFRVIYGFAMMILLLSIYRLQFRLFNYESVQNENSTDRRKATIKSSSRLADFVIGTGRTDHKSFISALDKRSNGYWQACYYL